MSATSKGPVGQPQGGFGRVNRFRRCSVCGGSYRENLNLLTMEEGGRLGPTNIITWVESTKHKNRNNLREPANSKQTIDKFASAQLSSQQRVMSGLCKLSNFLICCQRGETIGTQHAAKRTQNWKKFESPNMETTRPLFPSTKKPPWTPLRHKPSEQRHGGLEVLHQKMERLNSSELLVLIHGRLGH